MRRETVNGIPLLRFDGLSSVPGVVHAVTTRTGGVSGGPYATLNLGLRAGDDPANVLANRRRVSEVLDIEFESWVCAEQVHGGRVARVGAADRGRGAASPQTAVSTADALITDAAGVTLVAFSADCPLVGLLDPVAPAVGLAHASWRSTVQGITARTVTAMVEAFGCRPERMRAAIGPSAGPCCYEVGEEVLRAAQAALTGAERFFQRPPADDDEPAKPDGGRLRFDLWSANVAQLVGCGLRLDAIEVAGLCSICHSDEFFSYRVARGPVGHIAFLLGLMAD